MERKFFSVVDRPAAGEFLRDLNKRRENARLDHLLGLAEIEQFAAADIRTPEALQRAEEATNKYLELANRLLKGPGVEEDAKRALDIGIATALHNIERIKAHPNLRQNVGRAALQRGPLVYCLEEVDNGPNLTNVILPRDSELSVRFERELLGGAALITGEALRRGSHARPGGLYRPVCPNEMERFRFKAIPYSLWANREPGEMRVWIRDGIHTPAQGWPTGEEK